jgi:hypothetical protein
MENFIQVEKDDKTQKALEEKIKLFIAAQDLQILSYSYDIYSEKKISLLFTE